MAGFFSCFRMLSRSWLSWIFSEWPPVFEFLGNRAVGVSLEILDFEYTALFYAVPLILLLNIHYLLPAVLAPNGVCAPGAGSGNTLRA